MPFEIGNQHAAKSRKFEMMLERAIKQDDGQKLRKAADALLDLAAEGNLAAISMLADRLDGKPKQQVDVKADTSLTVILAQTLPDGGISSLNQSLTPVIEGEVLGGVSEAGGEGEEGNPTQGD